jgi:transcriptional regulator with XRE-family HTH domain
VDSAQPPVQEESLAQRIFRLRTERGLTQREISRPGVSYAYVSRIEKGERTPSLRAIRLLADGIGVTPEYLETGRDHTTTDELAAEALRLTDGGLWIMVTREGVTLTWQRAGDRYQLDQPGANLTETLYATLDRVEELLRLDVEEESIERRRAEIGRELAAPE